MRKRSESFYAKNEDEFISKVNNKETKGRRSRVSSLLEEEGEEEENNLRGPERRRERKEKTVLNLADDMDELGIEKSFTITQNTTTIEEDETNLMESIQKINSSFHSKDKDKFINEMSKFYKHILKEKHMNVASINPLQNSRRFGRSLTFDNIESININFDLLKNLDNLSLSSVSSCADSFSCFFLDPILSKNIDCVDEVLKFIFIGDQGVGKSFLISKLLNEKPDKSNYTHTNSFEIKKKNIKLFDKTIKLEFWDTNIEIVNSEICEIYYKICDGIFLIIDPTKIESVIFIEKQIQSIIKACPSVNFFLIANLKFLDYEIERVKDNQKRFVEVDKHIKKLVDKYDMKLYYINIQNLIDFKNPIRKFISLSFIKKGYYFNKNNKIKSGSFCKRKPLNKARKRRSLFLMKNISESENILGNYNFL